MKSALFAIAIIAASSLGAMAQKAAVSKDSNGAVHLRQLTPLSTVQIEIIKTTNRAVIANRCGVIVVRATQPFIIDGQTINPSDNNIQNQGTVPGNCAELSSYPLVFKINSGAIAIQGKTPSAAYAIQIPNARIPRRIFVNKCGLARVNDSSAVGFNLPTTVGGRADFPNIYIPQQSKAPLCIKGVLYYPIGFDKNTLASADGSLTIPSGGSGSTTYTTPGGGTIIVSGSSGGSSGSGTVTGEPQVNRNSNLLIVQNVASGTYRVGNLTNPTQFKNYTVATGKSCFVADRTQFGSPSILTIRGPGYFTPQKQYSWSTLTSTAVPTC
jgi:hypothetical protein